MTSTLRLQRLTSDRRFIKLGAFLAAMIGAPSITMGAASLFLALLLGFVIVAQHID